MWWLTPHRVRCPTHRGWRCIVLAGSLLLALPLAGVAQKEKPPLKPTFDIYGYVMTDMGFQANENDPLWFDVLRPTKLPSFHDEFGEGGRWFASVRQTRFGVKAHIPTNHNGDTIQTIFEWELFGVGRAAGETIFRLRHAYGEWRRFGAGQTWSVFMDPDVFPNSLEYWGPPGMVFFRNVQARWIAYRKGDSRVLLALERPGASADQGDFANLVELENVRGRFPLPDLSAQGRLARGWGHVQLAGIVRYMKWDDLLEEDTFDLGGHGVGWGLNLSSNVKIKKKHVLKLEVSYGKAIENYMNDATVDVGARRNFDDPRRPIEGELLPVLGIVTFLDLNWSKRLTSTVGWSMINIDNSDGQAGNAFHRGHYALANLLVYPVNNLMVGAELQYGRRSNFFNDYDANDFRLQVSARYNYSLHVRGN